MGSRLQHMSRILSGESGSCTYREDRLNGCGHWAPVNLDEAVPTRRQGALALLVGGWRWVRARPCAATE